MINSFLKYKTKKLNSCSPSIEDIKTSKKILFSLFTRYGDTIINLVVIKEFIKQYPNKRYLILCPRQMKPYVDELLPNIECIALNKRNLFDMFKINLRLKKYLPDIGFNPWSNGLDSCYFLTYCRNFLCYKDFDRPDIINHYQVVRRYLQLPEKKWKINELVLKEDYQKILICPQSTDRNRGITEDEIDALVSDFNIKYHDPDITIASMDTTHFRSDCQQFLFRKSAQSSAQFINLIKSSELVVCSDSGPLHISSALNKDIISVFYITNPEIVLNTGGYIYLNARKDER
jgi:ADP-heptose:LPS heptosyltransferase